MEKPESVGFKLYPRGEKPSHKYRVLVLKAEGIVDEILQEIASIYENEKPDVIIVDSSKLVEEGRRLTTTFKLQLENLLIGRKEICLSVASTMGVKSTLIGTLNRITAGDYILDGDLGSLSTGIIYNFVTADTKRPKYANFNRQTL